jgi:TP901-1 family phage major tail protein
MSERGTAFLLKIGGELKDGYATIAGLKTQKLAISGDPVALDPQRGWRDLLAGAGVRSVFIAASGIFTGSAGEKLAREKALSGFVDAYELSFESGERLRGRFMITRLEYAGDFNGERNYSIALESSGEVTVL